MFNQKIIRDVIICGDITEELAESVILAIHEINDENRNSIEIEEIRLNITTGGGDVTAALAICNVISSSSTPIIGIANGLVCSAGISILASCERRVGYKNTLYMIHEISYFFEGKVEESKDNRECLEILTKQMDGLIISNTKIKQSDLNRIYKAKKDFHFDSEKAKKWRLIQDIIG